MLFQHMQLPTLADVFQLLKLIELNMMEKHVIIFKFGKDNSRNLSISLT
jgi:hypothetical protein